MLIKAVNSNIVDVFIDNGWENWCRFAIIRSRNKEGKVVKKLNKIAGKAIPSNLFSILCKKLGV